MTVRLPLVQAPRFEHDEIQKHDEIYPYIKPIMSAFQSLLFRMSMILYSPAMAETEIELKLYKDPSFEKALNLYPNDR